MRELSDSSLISQLEAYRSYEGRMSFVEWMDTLPIGPFERTCMEVAWMGRTQRQKEAR